MRQRVAVVTGHKGFVGRHVWRALGEAGWTVYGIDLRGEGGGKADARHFFLTDDRRGVDLVVHCAAVVGGREVIDGAPLALASNLELDAGLFQWALRTRPGRIVYFSSSAAYPAGLQELEAKYRLAEDDIDPHLADGTVGVPDQLYGWTKLTGENLAVRARAEGLAVTVVRPFSGYGPDQDETYPFRAFVERARRREDPFHVWGTGQQVRDFIHISDIVSAALYMAENGIDGPVNLGTGRAVSMLHLARMVCRAAAYSPEILPLAGKPPGVAYRVADTARLNGFYTPKTELEQGILEALRG